MTLSQQETSQNKRCLIEVKLLEFYLNAKEFARMLISAMKIFMFVVVQNNCVY